VGAGGASRWQPGRSERTLHHSSSSAAAAAHGGSGAHRCGIREPCAALGRPRVRSELRRVCLPSSSPAVHGMVAAAWGRMLCGGGRGIVLSCTLQPLLNSHRNQTWDEARVHTPTLRPPVSPLVLSGRIPTRETAAFARSHAMMYAMVMVAKSAAAPLVSTRPRWLSRRTPVRGGRITARPRPRAWC